MSIQVAIHHATRYRYDRGIQLGAQTVRLRPAPHCRTKIPSYALTVEPKDHFLNWQQDPQSNWLARIMVPEKTDHFSVTVDLTVELDVINPFDFFLEPEAENFPFTYSADLKAELEPYLRTRDCGARFDAFIAALPREKKQTTNFLFDLNALLSREIGYLIRLEPGIQAPEETLTKKSGSCRDTSWLLVQVLRHLGLAARFASGYLIQLKADVKSLDGPSGASHDFTDMHAWCEVYLPGAGWVGLDPTSGLFAGEGHIPLACAANPTQAALNQGDVSGYLLTQPPPGMPRMLGADTSHAWFSIWAPPLGWVDLDPANDVAVVEGHVTVAYGRDYGDVSPLNGIILGGHDHVIEVGVDVIPAADA